MIPINAFVAAGLVAGSLFLASPGAICAADTLPESPRATEPRTVVRVNGEQITEEQVLRRLRAVDPRAERHRGDPSRWARLFESATEAEIRDCLLLQAAHDWGFEISSKELSSALERTHEMLGTEGYAAMLSRQGATHEEYAGFLKRRLLIDKAKSAIVSSVVVDDETLREYYRGHISSLKAPARVRLETLVFEERGLADRVAAQLREGMALSSVVRTHTGILLDDQWVSEDHLPPDVKHVVEAAALGDIVGPLETPDGILLIRMAERTPSRELRFEKARELIRRKLLHSRQQAALDAWYQQARRAANIEFE
jgi:hypothetical protein